MEQSIIHSLLWFLRVDYLSECTRICVERGMPSPFYLNSFLILGCIYYTWLKIFASWKASVHDCGNNASQRASEYCHSLIIFCCYKLGVFFFYYHILPLFWFGRQKELRDNGAHKETVIQLGHFVDSYRIDPSRVVQLSWQPRSGILMNYFFFSLIVISNGRWYGLMSICYW